MQGTNDRGTHGTDRLYMHALRDTGNSYLQCHVLISSDPLL